MPDKVAVYPGTFDPFHNGHLEIVKRGLGVFDKVIIAIGSNPGKTPLFSVDERKEMIESCIKGNPRLSCDSFTGLLVAYVKDVGASAILRGLRAISDFEMEFQLSLMNRKLDRTIETYYLMTAHRYLYVSSTIIKATVAAGGMPTGLLPNFIIEKLILKLEEH
jgi:pantetheine-phosphate adenylyltransferase